MTLAYDSSMITMSASANHLSVRCPLPFDASSAIYSSLDRNRVRCGYHPPFASGDSGPFGSFAERPSAALDRIAPVGTLPSA